MKRTLPSRVDQASLWDAPFSIPEPGDKSPGYYQPSLTGLPAQDLRRLSKITFAMAHDCEKMPFVKMLAYTYWQDGDDWLGYLDEFPDYWTQGASLSDLKDYLLDLYRDLSP